MLEVRLDDFYGSPAVMLAVSSNNGHDEATVWLSLADAKKLKEFLTAAIKETKHSGGQEYVQLEMSFENTNQNI